MADSEFTDLDLKLASADPSADPNPTELNSGESSFAVDPTPDLVNPDGGFQKVEAFENGESSMQNGSWSGFPDVKTPTPISQQQPAQSPSESQLSKRGRKRKGTSTEAGEILDPSKNPKWLPNGWKVVTKTRPNGKSAGSKDTYYHEPLKNRQFRSKREVLEYIASGTRARSNKKLKKEDNTGPSALQSSQPLNFESVTPVKPLQISEPSDFVAVNPPVKPSQSTPPLRFDSTYTHGPGFIRWTLGTSAGDLWTPFIGEEMVPEPVRVDWAAMFYPQAHKSAACRP